mgnify:CR=1 FL=1
MPLNIGGYKYDKKTKTFPVFINYDKSEDISDTTKYEDHFVPGFRDRLIAISKSGRSLQSEDVQNFLKAKERGIRVELFVRKNKDDKISKEFYYLGHMTASGNTKEFTMPNTQKTAVEIEWILDVPVREDIYEYIVNLVEATRTMEIFSMGASPRGTIALLRMAKAMAVIDGRDYVCAKDVQDVARDVLGHRVKLSARGKAQGITMQQAIGMVIANVTAPRV